MDVVKKIEALPVAAQRRSHHQGDDRQGDHQRDVGSASGRHDRATLRALGLTPFRSTPSRRAAPLTWAPRHLRHGEQSARRPRRKAASRAEVDRALPRRSSAAPVGTEDRRPGTRTETDRARATTGSTIRVAPSPIAPRPKRGDHRCLKAIEHTTIASMSALPFAHRAQMQRRARRAT